MALSRIFVAPKNGQGGVKKSKKKIFQKKYSKDGKKKFGDLWDHICPKSILGVRGGGQTHGHFPMLQNHSVAISKGNVRKFKKI